MGLYVCRSCGHELINDGFGRDPQPCLACVRLKQWMSEPKLRAVAKREIALAEGVERLRGKGRT